MVRPVHLTLLVVVVLWALNLTVTRYILQHGFEPLSYAVVRYGIAGVVFVGIAHAAERTMRIAREDRRLVGLAALALFVNQIVFVYALELTSASTIALLLGSIPAFAALIALALGLERMSRRFWLASVVSFAGVGLVAAGARSDVTVSWLGIALGIATAATWASYSVAVAPLMGRYTASRISAVVLPLGWVGMLLVGGSTAAGQDYALGWEVWLLLVAATLGPLVLTNILWFRALHGIGPSRATLIANLNPFVAAVFALLLLDERMTALQVAGGALIAGGILLARRRRDGRSDGRRVTSAP